MPAVKATTPTIAGVRVTHPDRVVYPALGVHKLEVVEYYQTVAKRMLPQVKGRPLTMKQCAPDADHCRYLRHGPGSRAPSGVRVVQIQEQHKVGDYLVIDDLAGLIALAQRNTIEFHTWNATVDRLETPDRLVFDLDPGPDVAWVEVVRAAKLVRSTLQDLDLQSWLKTTGGKGLHIVVPFVPEHEWATCLDFARTLASTIAEHDPLRYTTKFAKRGRERKVLIDYLRNSRTSTAVAAYSLRANANATVSVPISWDELTAKLAPRRWTLRTVPKRLVSTPDPWAAYARVKQRLRV
jgi:bifunctional non-homologous end joining protein LigD